MKNTTLTKVLAAMLAFTLTFANVILLGIYTRESIAASVNLEEQSTQVSNANIEFDAYFEEEGAQKHSKEVDVQTNNDNLYLKIKVTDGYLANGTVKLQNSNFKFAETEDVLTHVQSVNTEEGIVELNQIGRGESVILKLPIVMNTDSNFDVRNIDKVTTVLLEGTYVDNTANENSISKSIDVNAKMVASIAANLEVEKTKIVANRIDSNVELIAQATIKSNLQNSVLPIKETKIEIEIPKSNSIEPQRISLSAKSTKATNGGEERIFTSEDYTYENGKVTLTIKNEERENGIISWEKDAQDEIILTCVYVFTDVQDEEQYGLGRFEVSSTVTPYTSNETNAASLLRINPLITYQKVGEVVTYDIDVDNEMQKGYMLVEGAPNTPYVEKWTANVGNKELVDSIILENSTKYIDTNGNEYESNPIYTYTKISENILLNMLGEDGYIDIFNKDGQKITTLNKDNLEYTYSEETTYIKVETSKPILEGIIVLENGRAIKSAEYNKAQTELFNKIATKVTGKTNYNSSEVYSAEQAKEIALVEPKTTIDATISKTNLSTLEVNEGVRLTVELDTNDISTRLYKNPKVVIEFPSYIKEVNAQEGVLYGQGIEYDSANTRQYKNSNGNIVVEISTSGEQTAFNTSSVSDGAYVILEGDITTDELAPAVKENIKVSVTNEEETVSKEIEISYATENTIITRNAISGYNDANNEVKAIANNNTANIAANADARNAKIKLDVVNSKQEEISNLVIVGRVPFVGNKTVTTSEDLGSTFNANMASVISTDNNNVEIYYSENETATRNLTDTENGWTNNTQDLSSVKSYMIVFGEGALDFGNKASFAYDVNIPANLADDQRTYSTYAIFYNEGNVIKSQEAKSVGLIAKANNTEPGEEPTPGTAAVTSENLEVRTQVSSSGNILAQNASVKEGQYVDYAVTFTNKSQSDNLTFDVEVAKANGTFYGLLLTDYTLVGNEPIYEYAELEDEVLTQTITIGPGKTYTYKYTLIANPNTQGSNLTSTVSVKQNDVKVLEDIQTSNPITKGLLKVDLEYDRPATSNAFSKIMAAPIYIKVTNISDTDLSNIDVETTLPEILTYIPDSEYEQGSEYDSKEIIGNTLKYRINSLQKGKDATIRILADIGSMPINEESQDITLSANATVNNEKYYSRLYNKTVYQGETKIVANMVGSVEGEYVEDGQEIIYTITIENQGILDEHRLELTDALPDCLQTTEYTVIDSDGNETTTETSYKILTIGEYSLDAGAKMTIKIKAKVVADLAESETISNKASINGVWIEGVETNTVTYKLRDYINPDDPSNPDDPDNPVNPDDPSNPEVKTYSVTGSVWKDKDSDGRKDDDEEAISGVTVMLMNNQKSEFIKDNTGREITTNTQSDGTYKFEGLAEGEYVVIFSYDTDFYNATTYQKSGVNVSQNSDAIETTIKINGVDKKVAATDILRVNENKSDIDLGLVQSKIFDLKLDKMISAVIVQNSEGTKSYTFEEDKIAKVEIPAKYMVGTTLTIEYKIKVTNEGNVAGKVLKVIDYMPRELEFSSEINNEWYIGTDGNIYTNEFENVEINPGETKEITLVLTKTLKEEAAETINNYAEIQESYNVWGLADIDSAAGNNAQNEDDLSSADLIVTIKTGAMTYTLIALGTIALIGILGGGIYLIKKKVLTEEI